MNGEDHLIEALGMADIGGGNSKAKKKKDDLDDNSQIVGMGSEDDEEEDEERVQLEATGYEVVPDPKAEQVDLSDLRGATASAAAAGGANGGGGGNKNQHQKKATDNNEESEADLENLAELLPDVKQRRRESAEVGGGAAAGSEGGDGAGHGDRRSASGSSPSKKKKPTAQQLRKLSMDSTRVDKLRIQESGELTANDDASRAVQRADTNAGDNNNNDNDDNRYHGEDEASSDEGGGKGGGGAARGEFSGHDSFGDYPDSDLVMEDSGHAVDDPDKVPKEFMNMNMGSAAAAAAAAAGGGGGSGHSISTATQTHEVRMPMYLPTFKPATGCTNASDFIVRCFVARLRSGITVVKHGRSLSWKPAEGEPASSRRPPKLDLSTCLEVRHAWSPDPQNPMYTGTQILRQKCEAANAHKSFALIFKTRTVDITAVTADQCKVLMEGFSALCFRLQVANLAGRNGGSGAKDKAKTSGRPMPEEDGVSTTASNTLTNTSTPKGAVAK